MKIVLDRRSFARYRGRVDDAARASLVVASRATASAARGVDSRLGYDLDKIKAGFTVSPPAPSPRGWMAQVVGTHPLTMIFEKGSYAKRGRARAGVKAVEGNRGVKPVRMLRKGARVGKSVLANELRRRL